MNSKRTVSSTPTPAYVSYRTFVNFLRRFKDADTGLPAQIDRSVLSNMSGANQSVILGALEFLRLTDSSGNVTGRLKDLVAAVDDQDEWQARICDIYDAAYTPILGPMDLRTATGNMVRQAFKDNGGVEGSTAVKAISFALRLAKEAGLTISPHIKISQPQRTKKAGKKAASKKIKAKGSSTDSGGGPTEPEKPTPPPPGLMNMKITYPGGVEGTLQVPEGFTAAHVEYIAAILRGYAELKEAQK